METYGVYEYRKLPPYVVASLVINLHPDSRLFIKLQNRKVSTEKYLLSAIMDRLSILVWQNTEDGRKGRNKPKLLLDIINGKSSDVVSFNSGKEFEEERKRILEKIK